VTAAISRSSWYKHHTVIILWTLWTLHSAARDLVEKLMVIQTTWHYGTEDRTLHLWWMYFFHASYSFWIIHS
jgi:hypothetical protein